MPARAKPQQTEASLVTKNGEPEEFEENTDFIGINLFPQKAGEEAEAFASAHEWKDAPGSMGHRVTRQKLDDEDSSIEELVNQGLDEAEREQRAAAEPDRSEEDDL